jgi:gamma-glutamyltranspeptidase/glutathione hydrolase
MKFSARSQYAIEAMLAMAASIAAVYPHMNHIGGDGFWLIREPSGRVRALSFQGLGVTFEQPIQAEALPAWIQVIKSC